MFKHFEMRDLFIWGLVALVVYCASPLWMEGIHSFFGQPTKAELKVDNQVKKAQLEQLSTNNQQQSQTIHKQTAIQQADADAREKVFEVKQEITVKKDRHIADFKKKLTGAPLAENPPSDDDQAQAMLALVEEGYQAAVGNTKPVEESSEDTHFENKVSDHV